MDFLGRIRKLDSSLQRGLDNSFARVFGGKVVPNELEECLKQEIEDFLMQDANGQYLAPNDSAGWARTQKGSCSRQR